MNIQISLGNGDQAPFCIFFSRTLLANQRLLICQTSFGGLRLSLGREKEVLVCPNIWYTFGKILNIKLGGIRGRILKYRFRYTLIVFKCFKGSVEHYIKISESFTVIFNFDSRPSSRFTKRPARNEFFHRPSKFSGECVQYICYKSVFASITILG